MDKIINIKKYKLFLIEDCGNLMDQGIRINIQKLLATVFLSNYLGR